MAPTLRLESPGDPHLTEFRRRVASLVRGPVTDSSPALDDVLLAGEITAVDVGYGMGVDARTAADALLHVRAVIAEEKRTKPYACDVCQRAFDGKTVKRVLHDDICTDCHAEYDAMQGVGYTSDIDDATSPSYRSAMIESGRGSLLR